MRNPTMVFIDSRVADHPTLIAGLSADSVPVWLDAAHDGLEQMQAALAGRRDLASIRILAHGRPGALTIGSGELTRKRVASHAEALAEMGRVLGDDGDVQIYGCEVGKGSDGRAFVRALAEALGAQVAASSTPVGHAELGGAWRLDVGELRTPPIHNANWRGLLGMTITPVAHSYDHSAGEWRNWKAFAALRADGSVVTWGGAGDGGYSNAVATKIDGTIDVTQVFTSGEAFAALRADGSVVTWGFPIYGGDSSAVAAQLDGTVDVTQVFSAGHTFAALRADGSVVTWGLSIFGGDSSAVAAKLDGTIEVTQVFSTSTAFGALRADGSLVTWGEANYGGDSSTVAAAIDGTIDVTRVFSTVGAFAALRADGSLVTWGDVGSGGDSNAVATKLDGTIDVAQVASSQQAFAALRADGSVVTWGGAGYGNDSSTVAAALDGTIDVTQVASTGSAFAALRADGPLVTWGDSRWGGDSSAVATRLDGTIDVTRVFSTDTAFAALRADGSLVTWGGWGGDSSAVAAQLDGTIDVTQVFSTESAFAALRADGSVVTWGVANYGGASSAVAAQLDGIIDVTRVFSTLYAFAALRADGSVVTWGSAAYGGDSSAVASQLRDVVGMANPFTNDVFTSTMTGRIITGTAGHEPALNGGTNDDRIYGLDGNDSLHGGAGNDTLQGGLGNDTVDGGAGTDSASYADASGGVTVTLATPGVQQNTVNAGLDTLIGIEHLIGSANADRLTGDGNANQLSGDAGNDTLDGGIGADTLTGGDGSDHYYIDHLGDQVIETNAAAAGGTDLVHTTLASYTLGNHVENGRILATGAANLTGNALNNLLYAGIGNNVLDGGAGSDTVTWAYGVSGAVGVTASLASGTASGSGSDTLIGIEHLIGSANADRLTGDGNANSLSGAAGNDTLDGGAGADTLTGGDGSDHYYIDHLGDQVNETNATAAGGTDLVHTTLATYTLGNHIENGRILATGAANLTGNALNNLLYAGIGNNVLDGGAGSDTVTWAYAVIGTAGVTASLASGTATGSGSDTLIGIEHLIGSPNADRLTGDGNANHLSGGLGNDTLDGGGGADTLTGGDGSDHYTIDHLGDQVNETNATAAGGTDLVHTTLASYTLGNHVENGRILASGAANLTGNALNNLLYAGIGNNVLDGGAGSDTVTWAYAVIGAVGVTANLASGSATGSGSDTLISIEHLIGSANADRLTGDGNANSLSGAAGNDTLAGGLGNDSLLGGLGADFFRFDTLPDAVTNRDTIADFNVVDDTIQLENAVFTSLAATGTLVAGSFRSGAGITAAGDADDFVIYDSSSGALYYDANGNAGAGPVQIATLVAGLALSNLDFVIT